MKNTRLFFYFVIVIAFISCKNFNGYKISGTIKNADHEKVYLEDILGEIPVVIDTATIINNKFELKNYSTKGIYRLRFGEQMDNAIFLFIEDKDNIRVSADLKELNNYKVDGSKASSSIHELLLASKKNFAALNALAAELKTADIKSKDSLQILLTLGKKNHVDYIKKFIEKEPNNDVACFAINFLGPMMQEEVSYLISITEKLHNAQPDSKYIKTIYKQFQQYKDEMLAQSEGGVALNTQAPNIVLQSPNGDTVQLKDLQGNYVLLDFWASWCQPCRMENPNVVKLYNKFHAKGFDIFSVSLDANGDQWKKAIGKDGLVWKSHGCDFGGWNSPIAQMYSVKAIPCTFLLDKKGKVIAKNLRGEELEEKLAELFPEKIN